MKKVIYTIALLSFCSCALYAQNDVNITILVNQPYSPYLSDYLDLENQTIIQVQNLTNRELPIKLIGRITGDNGYEVSTDPNYSVFNPTVLMPLEIKTLIAGDPDLNFFNARNLTTNIPRDIGADVARTGILPEGNYNICLQALDPDTNTPISMEFCSPFSISYLDPPTPINPMCGQPTLLRRPNFVWTAPVGNTAGASFRYDLYVLKYSPNFEDPEAMLWHALDYNAGNVQVIRDILSSSYVWDVADPDLIPGDYAWIVVARDENQNVFFQNNGRSEVCTFKINELTFVNPNVLTPDTLVETITPGETIPYTQSISATNCNLPLDGACPLQVPADDTPIPINVLVVGSEVKVGHFVMTIAEITQSNSHDVTGIGTIEMPLLGFNYARVRLSFRNLSINSTQPIPEMIGGEITGEILDGAPSLIPNYTDPSFPSNPATLGSSLSNYLSGLGNNLLATGTNFVESAGLSFPIGIQLGGNILAITDIKISPRSAEVSIAVVVEISDAIASFTNLALSAKSVCLNDQDFCGNMRLQFDDIFQIDMQDGGKMSFLPDAATSALGRGDGTHIIINNDSIQSFAMEIDYEFPDIILTKPNNIGPASAHITASGTEWDDWIGDISMDDFIIADFEDMVFKNAAGVIDHSDLKNPQGFPLEKFNQPNDTSIIAKYNDFQDVRWGGFWLKTMDIELPGIFSNTDQVINLGVADMIIDDDGVSAEILTQHVFAMGGASVDTEITDVDFRFSMDELGISIINNSFSSGFFNGEMRLPITNSQHQQSYLDYSSTLSYSNANTQNNPDPNQPNQQGSTFNYEFIVQANNVYIPLFIGEMNFDTTTHIRLITNNATTKVDGLLNGAISITNPQNVPNVIGMALPSIQFQNITFDSDSTDFITGGNFGLASPQKYLGGSSTDDENAEVGGFAVTLSNLQLKTRTNSDGDFGIGMGFNVGINLTDLSLGTVSTTGGFTLWGKFVGGEPMYDEVEFNSLCIKGEITVLKFNGCFKIFSDDKIYGDGFYGAVNLKIQDMFEVSTTMQFGTINNMKYWYADGEMSFKPGITCFPGVDLYGFGGGAYSNMTRTVNSRGPGRYDNVTVDESNMGMGVSMSHIDYKPIRSGDDSNFGLKAKILFGMTGEETFYNGEVEFGLVFNTSDFGLDHVELIGDINIITSDLTSGDPILTGHAEVSYSPPLKHFQLDAHISGGQQGIFHLSGNLNISINGATGMWWFKLGNPGFDDGDRVTASIFDLAEIGAYLQFGNDIDQYPGIHPKIDQILSGRKSTDKVTGDDPGSVGSGQRNAQAMPYTAPSSDPPGQQPNNTTPTQMKAGGIILGAYAEIDLEAEFLIFYGRVFAGIGFDIALRDFSSIVCTPGINDDPPGLHGMYAQGQLYAGIELDLGIHVDIGIIDEKISLVSAGIAAALKMEGPKPFWAKGDLAGYFSVLGGLISGRIRYQFEVGDRCQGMTDDFLTNLKIISDVVPGGAVQKGEVIVTDSIPVNVNISFATLFGVNEIIKVPIYDEDGIDVERYDMYRLRPALFDYSLTGANKNWVLRPENYTDGNGMTLRTDSLLNRKTDFNLKLSATIEKCGSVAVDLALLATEKIPIYCDEQNWELARKDGDVWREEYDIYFTTNKGLDSLSDVVDLFPYMNERHFCYTLDRTPEIVEGLKAININAYNIGDADGNNFNLSWEVIYTPLNGGEAIHLPVNLVSDQILLHESIINGNLHQKFRNVVRFAYDYPLLESSTTYHVGLIVAMQPKNQTGLSQLNSELIKKTLYSNTIMDASGIVDDRKANKSLKDVVGYKNFYNYYFRTSSFSDLPEKIASLSQVGSAVSCALLPLSYGGLYEENSTDDAYAKNYRSALLPVVQLDIPAYHQANEALLKAYLQNQLTAHYSLTGDLPGDFNIDEYEVVLMNVSGTYYNGEEAFDMVEVNGYTLPSGFASPPLIELSNPLFEQLSAILYQSLIQPFVDSETIAPSIQFNMINGAPVFNFKKALKEHFSYEYTMGRVDPPLGEDDQRLTFTDPTGKIRDDAQQGANSSSNNNYAPPNLAGSSSSNRFSRTTANLPSLSTSFSKDPMDHIIKISVMQFAGGGQSRGVPESVHPVLDAIIKGWVDPNPIDQNWTNVGLSYDLLEEGIGPLGEIGGNVDNINIGVSGGSNSYSF